MKVGGQNSLAKIVSPNKKAYKLTWLTQSEMQPFISSTQFKNRRKEFNLMVSLY